MKIKTILAAVDGSKHAIKVADAAADLAHRYNARLVVLHVIRPIFEGRIANDIGAMTALENLRRTEYDALQAAGNNVVISAQRIARKRHVAKIETDVRDGDPATVILDLANRRRASLIVLGRSGLGRLSGLLLGSVSHKVTETTDRPCLIVS